MRKKQKRIHKIIFSRGKTFFVKEYLDNQVDISNLIKEEFQKGKILNKIINYPKPERVYNNKIIYEYLDIKYTLAERIFNNKYDYSYIIEAAKFLKEIHNNKIIHGDFTFTNIIITSDNKLYFIDASFSKYINQNRVFFKDQDIYQDISLFLRDLKWIRPLSKPWLFLQRKNIKNLIKCFLNTYFNGELGKFNEYKNAERENRFLKIYLKTIPKNEILRRLIWKVIVSFLIFLNKRKFL